MTKTANAERDNEIVVPQLVPHMEQYFGIWMMADPAFSALLSHVNALDLDRHIRANIERATQATLEPSDPQDGRRFELLGDDLALIDIVGTMTKYGSSLSEMQWGTIGVRQAVRAALADNQVNGILLRIDSPGGAVAGLDDLATDVFKAAQAKPVHAFCEDMCASAAYYVAAQATKVVANASAMVGSIGTYAVLYDYSKMAEEDGVKVHVIRAGEFKGAGTMGTKITPEQLAEFQRMVDTFSALFVVAVARGRGISVAKAKKWNDGAVHIGEEAKALGLVDAVQTFDEAVAGLRSAVGSGRSPRRAGSTAHDNKETVMTDTPTTPEGSSDQAPPVDAATKPATLAELKSAMPNAPADFRMKCLEGGMTLPQAQTQYTELLEARAEAADEKAKEAAAKANAPGVEGLGGAGAGASAGDGAGDGGGSGDPVAAWAAAVAEKMKLGMTKSVATQAVVHEHPELHQAYLKAHNDANPMSKPRVR